MAFYVNSYGENGAQEIDNLNCFPFLLPFYVVFYRHQVYFFYIIFSEYMYV